MHEVVEHTNVGTDCTNTQNGTTKLVPRTLVHTEMCESPFPLCTNASSTLVPTLVLSTKYSKHGVRPARLDLGVALSGGRNFSWGWNPPARQNLPSQILLIELDVR